MGNQPYIVGVGAANLDLNGASCAPIHLRDSNPGHISLSAGGVTRNVCENLARYLRYIYPPFLRRRRDRRVPSV